MRSDGSTAELQTIEHSSTCATPGVQLLLVHVFNV
jgi:hypothetical protein